MSSGPWKSEPAAGSRSHRASVMTPGGVERRFRHEHVARETFDALEGGGAYTALFVRVKRRGWELRASKGAT